MFLMVDLDFQGIYIYILYIYTKYSGVPSKNLLCWPVIGLVQSRIRFRVGTVCFTPCMTFGRAGLTSEDFFIGSRGINSASWVMSRHGTKSLRGNQLRYLRKYFRYPRRKRIFPPYSEMLHPRVH